jgi:hypothetical protein
MSEPLHDPMRLGAMRRMVHYLAREAADNGLPGAEAHLRAVTALLDEALRGQLVVVDRPRDRQSRPPTGS